MTPSQLARLEYLDSVEFQTPFEEAEHKRLLGLQSDLMAAFALLLRHDLHPTWVGGQYIVVGQCVVRSLADAERLISCR